MNESVSKHNLLKKKHSLHKYKLWTDQLYASLPCLINMAENPKMCSCVLNDINSLLLTCKEFSIFLPLHRKKCLHCKYDHVQCRSCDSCNICTFCAQVFCCGCRKLGVLQCDRCTCTDCGQSENFTGYHPGFCDKKNQKLCWVCARKRSEHPISMRTFHDNIDFFHSFHKLVSFDSYLIVQAFSREKQRNKDTESVITELDSKLRHYNVVFEKQQSQKYIKKQKPNQKVRTSRQIQQRNARK